MVAADERLLSLKACVCRQPSSSMPGGGVKHSDRARDMLFAGYDCVEAVKCCALAGVDRNVSAHWWQVWRVVFQRTGGVCKSRVVMRIEKGFAPRGAAITGAVVREIPLRCVCSGGHR